MGIALTGSAAAAVYREEVAATVPPGAPDGAAEAARDTLGATVAVAAEDLPEPLAEPLISAAKDAFVAGFQVAAVVAIVLAVIVIAVADRQRAGPVQQWTAALAGGVWRSVEVESSSLSGGQHASVVGGVDEEVCFEYQVLAFGGAELRGTGAGLLGQFGRGERTHDRLEEGDIAYPIGVPGRPVEGERAASVVADEHDLVQPECVEERLQVASEVGEPGPDRSIGW